MDFFAFKKLGGVKVMVLVFFLCALAFSLSLPTKVTAQVPVWDGPNTPNQYIAGISTMFEKLKDFGLDSVAWIAAKMVIRQISADLVEWINGGFDGNPAFIANPGGFFLSVADETTGQMIFEKGLNYLCAPIKPLEFNIKAALLFSYQGPTRNRSCTISDIFGQGFDYLSYMEGQAAYTFDENYWSRWFAITQVPQNNIYGQSQIASAELAAQVVGSKNINKTVADWNKGFKSVTDEVNGLIKTPGSFVQDQLYNVMQSDVRQLEVADEIAEMISSVSGALMNQVLTQGLSSLTQGGSDSRYTSLLRNADPTDYYYKVSAGEQSTWSSVTNTAEQDAQGNYSTTYADQQSQAEANQINSNTLVQQEPEIRLNDLTASQSCVVAGSLGQNYGPNQAIDGGGTTYTRTDCEGSTVYPFPTQKQPSWWWVQLAQPEYLDEIQFDTKSSSPDHTLHSWVIGTTVYQPRLILHDSQGTQHTILLTDGSFDVNVVLPSNMRDKLMSKVEIQARRGDTYGIWVTEIELFRRLKPVVDARNLPSSLASTTAGAVGGFDPRPSNWVTAIHYPTDYAAAPPIAGWRNPQPVPQTSINVRVVNSQGSNVEIPPISTSPLRYQLAPGSYKFEYVAVMDGLSSATSTRILSVPN